MGRLNLVEVPGETRGLDVLLIQNFFSLWITFLLFCVQKQSDKDGQLAIHQHISLIIKSTFGSCPHLCQLSLMWAYLKYKENHWFVVLPVNYLIFIFLLKDNLVSDLLHFPLFSFSIGPNFSC